MKVKRRFPNYFTVFEETEHEITTKEELLELDWVKNYSEIKGHMGVYYSPSTNKEYPDHLMALSKNEEGRVIYFVVGYIFGNGAELGLVDYKTELKNSKQ